MKKTLLHQGEWEQFTAGDCGEQDSPAGQDRGSGSVCVRVVEKWNIHGMEMRQLTYKYLSARTHAPQNTSIRGTPAQIYILKMELLKTEKG